MSWNPRGWWNAGRTMTDRRSNALHLTESGKSTLQLIGRIAREHQQPNAADWSGLLAAGSFRRENQRVFGQWPLSRAFVEAQFSDSF